MKRFFFLTGFCKGDKDENMNVDIGESNFLLTGILKLVYECVELL